MNVCIFLIRIHRVDNLLWASNWSLPFNYKGIETMTWNGFILKFQENQFFSVLMEYVRKNGVSGLIYS